ncbi:MULTISPECIES: Gmad2 immunoglobulin-like domain-containing protein [unclassified Nocardia]|uniref:Gmad2 immunoglobulin-like domain-containing protein n=1 Tax=unclassified Nocardia TaxID=2637762 RepID=UPI001CE48FA4|nr:MULTISPECIES: Gmad2 immunoglobulin-like domain-containing protein [unclassified Nocardia]
MITKIPAPQRRSTITLVIAAAAAVLAAAALVFAVTRGGGGNGPTTVSPVPTAITSGPVVPPSVSTSAQPTGGSYHFGYQPLYPYATAEQAADMEQSVRAGHQPWRLDAGTIAQMFTQWHLGFQGIDKVWKVDVRGDEAWAGVGFANPNGAPATAAVIHLVRFGPNPDSLWEVVGTEDTTLTLTAPAYGSTVRSPVTAGGRITGVDESLRVQVRQTDQSPAGEVSRIPAGGTETPWSARVPFTAACPGTLTVAVSTGGHIADVERFAITGVRC